MYRLYCRVVWKSGSVKIHQYVWVDPDGVIAHMRFRQPLGFITNWSDDENAPGQRFINPRRGGRFRNVTPVEAMYQGTDGNLARGYLPH